MKWWAWAGAAAAAAVVVALLAGKGDIRHFRRVARHPS